METYSREPLAVYEKTLFTEEEYLSLERSSELRHEFFEGEIFAMSGTSVRHNLIFTNLFGDLAYKLKTRLAGHSAAICVSIFRKTPYIPTLIFQSFAVISILLK